MDQVARVRPFTLKDYNGAYALWTRTAGIGLRPRDDSREGIERFLARNPATCFAAERAGEIVGVILCGHDGRRGYIYHAVVASEHQGHGLRCALVQAALSALRAEGIAKCALVAYEKTRRATSSGRAWGLRSAETYATGTSGASRRIAERGGRNGSRSQSMVKNVGETRRFRFHYVGFMVYYAYNKRKCQEGVPCRI